MLKIIGAAIAEHWPKILIAVLCAFVVAAVAKCEREEVRQNDTLVTTGEQKATIKTQDGVLRNVEKAQAADANPSLDADRVVRGKYDRCTVTPAACQ